MFRHKNCLRQSLWLLVRWIVGVAVLQLSGQRLFKLQAQQAVVNTRDAVNFDTAHATVAVVGDTKARQNQVMTSREPETSKPHINIIRL